MSVTAGQQTTPLHAEHVRMGGRMVDFAGWSMPVQYQGAIAEHMAVREAVGIFDVSHMGQILVSGDTAEADLQRLLSNDLGKVGTGEAQYTLLTNERGGIEDDLIAYRLAPDEPRFAGASFLLVVNAANTNHDMAWLSNNVSAGTVVVDASHDHAMIAVQGPTSVQLIADALSVDLTEVPRFGFVSREFGGQHVFFARTGYTGEDGFELLTPPGEAARVWRRLVDAGAVACGLASRDTLRLEACYPLHGNDITPHTTAVSAGLGWTCGWGTGFVGESALEAERAAGPSRKLQPIWMAERAIARAGCEVRQNGSVIGSVTSGGYSPVLRHGIALGYVDTARDSDEVEVDVRGKLRPARIGPRPFVS